MVQNRSINSPVRHITAKVELYNGSTLLNTYSSTDNLISIDIERVGDESKFFGFGICAKCNVHLRDTKREIEISTANSLKIYFDNNNTFPSFYVTEVHRDTVTNELSITAYDMIYKATEHTIAEVALPGSYTLGEAAELVAQAVTGKSNIYYFNTDNTFLELEYPEGANLEGTETIREVLDDIAEVL